MAEGKLVPSELLVELVKKEVVKEKEGIYLLDGFPRNMENLEVWDRLMKGFLIFIIVLFCKLKFRFSRCEILAFI